MLEAKYSGVWSSNVFMGLCYFRLAVKKIELCTLHLDQIP